MIDDDEQTIVDCGDFCVIRCKKCRATWEVEYDGTEDYKYTGCPRCCDLDPARPSPEDAL